MTRSIYLALALCALPLHAEESTEAVTEAIYESIDGVAIGRVFLSPADRKRLDAARRRPAAAAKERTVAAVAGDERNNAATGYIRVGDRAPAVFRDGRFVRLDRAEPPEPRPPGAIRRHVPREGSDAEAGAR